MLDNDVKSLTKLNKVNEKWMFHSKLELVTERAFFKKTSTKNLLTKVSDLARYPWNVNPDDVMCNCFVCRKNKTRTSQVGATLKDPKMQSLSNMHGVVARAFGLYRGGTRFESLSTHHCRSFIPTLVVWSMTKNNAFGGGKQK